MRFKLTHGDTYEGRYIADFECQRCHKVERRTSPICQDGKLREHCECGSGRAVQVGEWYATALTT